ncbi:MAG: MotA/TolQ/ExbB proton channel family protein [Acidobacteriota bacterium]
MPRPDTTQRSPSPAAKQAQIGMLATIILFITVGGWISRPLWLPIPKDAVEVGTSDLLTALEEGRVGPTVLRIDDRLSGTFETAEDTDRDVVWPIDEAEPSTVLDALDAHGIHVYRRPDAKWRYAFNLAYFIAVMIFFARGRPHFLASAYVAGFFVACCSVWHAFRPLPESQDGFFSLGALRWKLFESGPIPLAVLWTACVGFYCLAQIWLRDGPEKANDESQRLAALLRRSFAINQDLGAVVAMKNDLLDGREREASLHFVAVRWCEVALPLLGFLGTVIGIGAAMGGVSSGVATLFRGASMDSAIGDLNHGFAGMAVAFDTTFLGLAGLLIVGAGHVAVRKHLAVKWSLVRRQLDEKMGQWTAPPPPTIGPSVEAISVLAAIRRLETTVLRGDEAASEFRQKSRQVIETVVRQDPQFRSIREVLFRPVVEFRPVAQELFEAFRALAYEHCGADWTAKALGITTTDRHRGGVVVTASDHSAWIVQFDLDDGQNLRIAPIDHTCHQILPLADDGHYVGLGPRRSEEDPSAPQTTELVRFRISSGGEARILDSEPSGGRDRLLPMIDRGSSALWLRGRAMNDTTAHLWSGGQWSDLQSLGQEVEWKLFSVHAKSRALFALGVFVDSAKSWQLLSASVDKEPVEEPAVDRDPVAESADAEPPPTRDVLRHDACRLPADLQPINLLAIDHQTVLIQHASGELFYWDHQLRSPLRLEHPAWKAAERCVLVAGVNGWFAVVHDGRLSMWQVHAGGHLERYGNGVGAADFGVSGADPDSFQATSDGRFLFAIAEQGLFTWEFPRHEVEQL